jgi:hypothetical protein
MITQIPALTAEETLKMYQKKQPKLTRRSMYSSNPNACTSFVWGENYITNKPVGDFEDVQFQFEFANPIGSKYGQIIPPTA